MPALLLAALLAAPPSAPPSTPPSTPQTAIPGVGPTGPVSLLADGFAFTEGPAWEPDSGTLAFSDIPNDRILVYRGGERAAELSPVGRTNGLMFDGAGNLIGCSMKRGALLRIPAGFDLADAGGDAPVRPPVETLAATHDGTRFNACNDLVIDRAGGVYFTDPRYSAPEPWPQGAECVYYRDPRGAVTRLIDELDGSAPNGVTLSPDESTLYVVPTQSKTVRAYPVMEPGVLGEGRDFATLRTPDGADVAGGDGLTVDTAGRLYVTTKLGVQVVDADGAVLGVIAFPKQPANCAFGGPDGRTLYATCREAVYSVPMEAAGHRFTGVVGE